jgi:hypothetical protein
VLRLFGSAILQVKPAFLDKIVKSVPFENAYEKKNDGLIKGKRCVFNNEVV